MFIKQTLRIFRTFLVFAGLAIVVACGGGGGGGGSDGISPSTEPLANGIVGRWIGHVNHGNGFEIVVEKINGEFYITYGFLGYTTTQCPGMSQYSWEFGDTLSKIKNNEYHIYLPDDLYYGDGLGSELHIYFDSDMKLHGNCIAETFCPARFSDYFEAEHCFDKDGDGYDSCDECDDSNPNIHPGASEICDGLDNNCDGQVDEGLFYPDADQDGYGDKNAVGKVCPAPEGYIANNKDCDDSNASINPGQAEICRNDFDDNCNGIQNENCTVTTLLVPSIYNTIQDAINQSINGDVIEVANGTYFENLILTDKSVTVKSQNGPRATIIDGNNSGNVVAFTATNPSRDRVMLSLEGLTLQNGHAENGGAIYNNSYSTTINNCIVINNTSTNDGGGIYVNGLNFLTITNSIISGNSAGTSGGGIFYSAASQMIVTNSIITGNIAIAGNGGGIYKGPIGRGTVTNSTISGNNSNISGGGIYDEYSLTIKNCIIWGNLTNGLTSGYELVGEFYSGGIPSVTFSDVRNKGYLLGSNINSDPLFVDPRTASLAPTSEGNYHLMSNSPCIDRGTATNAPSVDIDGDSRPQGTGFDMGSDEYF